MSNLPAATPVADLVRWAKIRWRIEHDYRELKHGLGLDHFEGRTWRGWHHHVTFVTAAQVFLTLRRLDPKRRCRPDPLPGSRRAPRPVEVLDRHLHHLRPAPADQQNQPSSLQATSGPRVASGDSKHVADRAGSACIAGVLPGPVGRIGRAER
ncbi:transposase [Streptomyces sp. NPDC001507]|uniref:transposase n=1 Tax=Streptomyces sp. NPDC001507 TaxID=3364579 RepID=UPI00367A5D96